jgi:hypothetical protein
MTPEDDPVGLAEIADRLGVKRQTADNWQQRGVLPAPRWTVGGRRAWSWQRDIEPWARKTGRLDNPNVGVNYDTEPCNCDRGVCFLHSQQGG